MPRDLSNHSTIELYYLLKKKNEVADAAFRELYERLAPKVFKYCRRVLGNEELAQDIFQETFVKFYRSAEQERTMTNVQAYILRIARNLCLNAKSSKYYGLASLEGVDLHETGDLYDRKQLLDLITAAIECLPIELREPFVLREYDGLPYADIAEILDISNATVKIRLFRARQSIRKTLAPYLADLTL